MLTNMNFRDLCSTLTGEASNKIFITYMEENDYKSVVNDLKLANGLIFGLPVVFDTDDVRVVPGATVLLQYKNVPIAVFHVSYEDYITCFTC